MLWSAEGATIVVVKLGRGKEREREREREEGAKKQEEEKLRSSVRNRNDPEMTSPLQLHSRRTTTAFRRGALTLLFIPRVYGGFASLRERESRGGSVQQPGIATVFLRRRRRRE